MNPATAGATLKIGTRGSPLALKQTALFEDALRSVAPHIETERVIIRTSGDWRPEQGETRLSEAQGGKGLFAREIERALLAGTIDCAMHSLKDMPSFLPEGLCIDHVLKRGDPRDAFICHKAKTIMDLPGGALVGTSALRRQALILSRRPDLKIVPLRGNVQTRLAKLSGEQVDATFLAVAGLERLGIAGEFIHPLSIEEMLPACGQGTIAVESRIGDEAVRAILDLVHDSETGLFSWVERAALRVLDGSCHTPIGAYARTEGGLMRFDLVVASPDGMQIFSESGAAPVQDRMAAERLGTLIGAQLKSRVPPDIFS